MRSLRRTVVLCLAFATLPAACMFGGQTGTPVSDTERADSGGPRVELELDDERADGSERWADRYYGTYTLRGSWRVAGGAEQQALLYLRVARSARASPDSPTSTEPGAPVELALKTADGLLDRMIPAMMRGEAESASISFVCDADAASCREGAEDADGTLFGTVRLEPSRVHIRLHVAETDERGRALEVVGVRSEEDE